MRDGYSRVKLERLEWMEGKFSREVQLFVLTLFMVPLLHSYTLHYIFQKYRPEMVVGWYHSHPGFGCWLSGVDINTQQVC
jgi:26S proteasome regulatory subunit N11